MLKHPQGHSDRCRHQYRPINTYEQMPICIKEKEHEMDTDDRPPRPITVLQVKSSRVKSKSSADRSLLSRPVWSAQWSYDIRCRRVGSAHFLIPPPPIGPLPAAKSQLTLTNTLGFCSYRARSDQVDDVGRLGHTLLLQSLKLGLLLLPIYISSIHCMS